MTDSTLPDEKDKSFSDTAWNYTKLVEELFLHLAKNTKYTEQARYLLYRIPVYKPTPAYVVNVSDLYDKLKEELDDLDDHSLNRVMKDAIGRLFENEKQDYYLLSVKRLLRWKFEE